MDKLIKLVDQLGWFTGELEIDIKIRRSFEGYSGKASETWETKYIFDSNETKSNNDVILFPELHVESKPYESFKDFIGRVETHLLSKENKPTNSTIMNKAFPSTAVSFADSNYVLTFGKHKNKRLGDIVEEEPTYILWLNDKNVLKIDPVLLKLCEYNALDDGTTDATESDIY